MPSCNRSTNSIPEKCLQHISTLHEHSAMCICTVLLVTSSHQTGLIRQQKWERLVIHTQTEKASHLGTRTLVCLRVHKDNNIKSPQIQRAMGVAGCTGGLFTGSCCMQYSANQKQSLKPNRDRWGERQHSFCQPFPVLEDCKKTWIFIFKLTAGSYSDFRV